MGSLKYIAVGIDKDDNLWKGHFGMAPYYNIYSTSGEKIEKRKNPYGAGNGNHEHHDNPKLIVKLLNDCKVFIAKRMGQESKRKLLEMFGITAILTDADETERALTKYLGSNGKSNPSQ